MMRFDFNCLDNDAYRLIFYQRQTGRTAAFPCPAGFEIAAANRMAVRPVQEKIA